MLFVCLFYPKSSHNTTILNNRVCTIRTSAEVVVLVLGVEPEPNLMVVLKLFGSVSLVWVGHREANRILGLTKAIKYNLGLVLSLVLFGHQL